MYLDTTMQYIYWWDLYEKDFYLKKILEETHFVKMTKIGKQRICDPLLIWSLVRQCIDNTRFDDNCQFPRSQFEHWLFQLTSDIKQSFLNTWLIWQPYEKNIFHWFEDPIFYQHDASWMKKKYVCIQHEEMLIIYE